MTPRAKSWIAAMKRTAPRISDWMWPLELPLKIASIRNGSQAQIARTKTTSGGGDEDPQRLVAGVDPQDRQRVAPHVGARGAGQPRLAGLRVGRDRHLVDRDQHFPGLDQALQRVGEVVDDEQLQGGLAVVGAEAGGGVGDLGPGDPPHDPAAEPLQPFLRGREVARSRPPRGRRRPCRPRRRRSARPAWRRRRRAYWLSASVLTTTSAPSFRQASSPAWKPAASPLLLVRRTMCSTPCSRATSTVRSVEPSSTTSSSTASKPAT